MNKYVKKIAVSIGVIFLFNSYIFSQESPLTPHIKKVSVEPDENFPGKVAIYIDTTNTTPGSEFVVKRQLIEPEVIGGVTYEVSYTIGAFPFDTNVAFDTTARAHKRPEPYEIYATHPDYTEQSENSPQHQSIFLEITKNDSCSKAHFLNWTPYIGYSINSYSIQRRSIVNNDTTWAQIGTAYSDTSYSNNDVSYYEEYVYRIMGSQSGSKQTFSNEVSVITMPLDSIDTEEFYVDLIENSGTQMEVGCHVDDSADILYYQLFREIEFSDSVEVDKIDYSNDDYLTFTDPNKIKEATYKIIATNTCHETTGGELLFKPLVLHCELKGEKVLLNWNASYFEDENYQVELTIDSEPTQYINTETIRSFTLNLDSSIYENNENFCFKIVGTTTEGYKSYSNTACIPKTPGIKMYNAFTPNSDGLNDKIGPDFFGAVIVELDFIIYNKFGEKIFHATNPDSDYDWDGNYKGLKVQEGGYLYYIRIKTSLGKELEKSGVISVIYP
ncbi:MAG: gliding motility-associated C-terminal domain-containing protein [Salinivirgaceae bacterium]|nr:gliding motility-associated C-terminal domain-containing protein [Salinivirgaceae bacterium]